ncbi:hypothetical protein ACLKA6_001249 [Drosophila palustris]
MWSRVVSWRRLPHWEFACRLPPAYLSFLRPPCCKQQSLHLPLLFRSCCCCTRCSDCLKGYVACRATPKHDNNSHRGACNTACNVPQLWDV